MRRDTVSIWRSCPRSGVREASTEVDVNDGIQRSGLVDSVSERDFYRYLPSGISFHSAHLSHDNNAKPGFETLVQICHGFEAAINRLVQIEPEAVVFSCASGCFFRAEGWDREVQRRIEVGALIFFEAAKSKDMSNIPPADTHARIVKEPVRIAQCDALFISCTGLRVKALRPELETELDLPVLTSISTSIWTTARYFPVGGSATAADDHGRCH